jgi:hypothetical protein
MPLKKDQQIKELVDLPVGQIYLKTGSHETE